MLSDQVPHYIIDLLQQSPSVDIRGLGRFEAIFHPAAVDSSASRINPPFLRPGFEPIEVTQHGLLSQYIAYVTGAPVAVADKAIDDFVNRILAATASDNAYEVDQFGTFVRTENNSIRFTPDWDAFNLLFRGLEVIELHEKTPDYTDSQASSSAPVNAPAPLIINETPSTSIDSIAEAEPKIILIPEILPVENNSRAGIEESTSRLWWIILISALVLITVLCGYLAWDILSNRNNLEAITMEIPDSTSIAQPGDKTEIIDSVSIDVKPLPIDTHESSVPDTKPAPAPSTPNVGSPQPDGDHCYIVVGAFANPDNIARMEHRLAELGYTSAQLKGRTMTRIGIRTTCDKDSLNTLLDSVRASINPEAWIY